VHSRVVLLLSLAGFASAASLRATDPLLVLIAAEYAITPGAAAAVITAFAVSYGLFQVLHGPLGDRIGRIRVVCAAVAISALGSVACAMATSHGMLVAARFITGITVGALVPVSMAWIADVVAYERRQAVLARFLIGHILGIAFGVSAAGTLAAAFGWRAIFWVLAGLYLLITLLLLHELRGNAAMHVARDEAPATLAAAFRNMAGLLGRPWVRVILVTVFVEGAFFYGALTFVAYDLHQRHGIGVAASGALVSAFAAGGLLYAVSAGRVVPLLGERGLVLGGGTLLGVAYLFLALAPGAGLAVFALVLAGGGIYMLHNTLQVNATQMAPETRGGAIALFAFCLFGGNSFGVWLAARVVDDWGTRPVFMAAGIGLALLALEFRRRLANRVATR
jgi:predicted MFS family arabinose efflux permease